MLERAENIFELQKKIHFSEGEPCCSILNMLYDYFAPEEIDTEEGKEFLQDARSRLMRILAIHLSNRGEIEDVPIIVKYLEVDYAKCFSIRDLLYVLMNYIYRSSDCFQSNIFSEILQTAYRCKEECDFIVCLFKQLDASIKSKISLRSAYARSNNSQLLDKQECMECIIAYCLHILLSFKWETLFTSCRKIRAKSMASPQHFSGKNSPPKEKKIEKNKKSSLHFLKPNKRCSELLQTEEIIVNFILQKMGDGVLKETRLEKGYLGNRVYLCLLSQIFVQQAKFNEKPSEIPKLVMAVKETDLNVSKFRLFYGKILQNLKAFEKEVQNKILCDVQKFIQNPVFRENLLSIDYVFDALLGFLLKKKSLIQSPSKRSIEDLVVIFIISYWKERQKREIMQRAFLFLRALDSQIITSLCEKVVMNLLNDLIGTSTDEGKFSIIQLVYVLEDVAMENPTILAEPKFTELIAKLILYLEEINMLYFGYPPLCPLTFAVNIDLNNTSQREGGMIRVILKILLGIIIAIDEKSNAYYCELALKLLKLFIFRNRSTHVKLTKAIKITKLLSSLCEFNKEDNAIHFVDLSCENENTKGGWSHFLNIIWQEKGVTQKTVEELFCIKKNCLESKEFKLFFILVQVTQALIYVSFGVTKYKDINMEKEAFQKFLTKPKNPYKAAVLGKLVAKLIGMGFGKISNEDLTKILMELVEKSGKGQKNKSDECFSNYDFFWNRKAISKKLKRECATPPTLKKKYGDTLSCASEKSKPTRKKEKRSSQKEKAKLSDTISAIREIEKIYLKYAASQTSIMDCISQVQAVVVSINFTQNIMPFLHEITTEDVIFVDEILVEYMYRFPIETFRNKYRQDLILE